MKWKVSVTDKEYSRETYPECRGPWDGPTNIVPGSDAGGLDGGQHYKNRRV